MLWILDSAQEFVNYFSPVTLEKTSSYQMDQLLDALSQLEDTGMIFTMPNADTDGRVLFEKIQDFVEKENTLKLIHRLTSSPFILHSTCQRCYGNSSSGLLEVPVLKKLL